ncbi:MAG: hypothetical protein ABI772_11735 [Bacteroidota bacterium]
MIRLLIAAVFCCLAILCSAQTDSVSVKNNREDFLFFLLANHQFDDFNFLGDKLLGDSTVSTGYKDTVAFVMAESFQKQKNDSAAIKYYKMVSDQSPFIYASQLKVANFETGIKQYDAAYHRIDELYVGNDVVLSELKTFQLAGISLLKKNITAFDSLTAGFIPSTPVINSELNEISVAALQLQSSKRKSPFVAGALSAVVPGLGKVYTGKKGEGLAAFLKVVPLAAIALENYNKHGWKDPQFLIFGSLFGLFYVGNIWGSTLSAQIVYNERINEINHNIRFSLNVSVENIFR